MLFPNPFPNLLTPGPAMRVALTAALAQTGLTFPAERVHLDTAISIAAVINPTSTSPRFAYAGFRDTEMHFSGSLLKAAAMFAAFQLRQSASQHVLTAGDCTPSGVFNDLKSAFNQNIKNAAPRFQTEPGITENMRVPKYPTIFGPPEELASGGCLISFSQVFAANMRGMTVPSHNPETSACIQALGYSWINGLLAKTGLFNPSTNTGIWLAGTFTGAFPAVRVPSMNDGPSAQSTTTVDMARLFALIVEGSILDSHSIDGIASDMRQLLADAQSAGDSSWMTTGARQHINGLGAGFTSPTARSAWAA
ncbi:hypothetical protein U2F26_33540 [Micromonospora sp. 4G57]|uniref:Uncharacterized protein n=1 Tax=Micromonospora sicca TaxID=2202420 RepID=A0ABU5JP30_9ACTN|nr:MULTISPECIES: hypothetical protein [unclassified Micromonospora]MDZ5447573.1 hypothetical protein [Micromonospora sp. 4G57]MDZ5494351.1 hypothetical protein [Micromonospora sp. 4G53]